MISRSAAEWLIREALLERGACQYDAQHCAARLVAEIFGVLGADSVNPRYGPLVDEGGD